MFDYVDIKIKCPACGEVIEEFQTKSTNCLLESVDPLKQMVINFYSECPYCGVWVEGYYNPKEIKIEDYVVEVKGYTKTLKDLIIKEDN